MFGFSLGKLLVLAAVILAVWYGFKYVSRLQYQRERKNEAIDRVERRKDAERGSIWGLGAKQRGRDSGDAQPDGAQDMVECEACKAYVPSKGARNCGRPDCPY
jgi:uncharacterized protein